MNRVNIWDVMCFKVACFLDTSVINQCHMFVNEIQSLMCYQLIDILNDRLMFSAIAYCGTFLRINDDNMWYILTRRQKNHIPWYWSNTRLSLIDKNWCRWSWVSGIASVCHRTIGDIKFGSASNVTFCDKWWPFPLRYTQSHIYT